MISEAVRSGTASTQRFIEGINRLRLDSAGMRRHLVGRGFEATLQDIARGSERSNAPFLRPDLTAEEAGAIWSHLFKALIALASLERAVLSLKSDMDVGYAAVRDSNDAAGEDLHDLQAQLTSLKAERDALRRDLGAGTIWSGDASFEDRSSLH